MTCWREVTGDERCEFWRRLYLLRTVFGCHTHDTITMKRPLQILLSLLLSFSLSLAQKPQPCIGYSKGEFTGNVTTFELCRTACETGEGIMRDFCCPDFYTYIDGNSTFYQCQCNNEEGTSTVFITTCQDKGFRTSGASVIGGSVWMQMFAMYNDNHVNNAIHDYIVNDLCFTSTCMSRRVKRLGCFWQRCVRVCGWLWRAGGRLTGNLRAGICWKECYLSVLFTKLMEQLLIQENQRRLKSRNVRDRMNKQGRTLLFLRDL